MNVLKPSKQQQIFTRSQFHDGLRRQPTNSGAGAGGGAVWAVKACHLSASHGVDFFCANLCETDLGLENQDGITR